MTKKLVFIVLIAAMVFALSCSQSSPATPAKPAAGAATATSPAAPAQPTAAPARPTAAPQTTASAPTAVSPQATAKPTAAPASTPKPAAQATVLKLSSPSPVGNLRNLAAELMAKMLDQKTNGQYKIQIFASASLYQSQTTPNAVSQGAVDMGIPTSVHLQPMIQGFGFELMGYTFKDRTNYDRFIDDPRGGVKMLNDLEKLGIKGLAMFDTTGDTGIWTTKPMTNLRDVQGLKIMSASPMLNDMVQNIFKAITVTVPVEEAATAMQTGLVQGRLSGIVPGVENKFYDAAKFHMQLPGLVFSSSSIIMNLKKWNSLPPDVQKIMTNEIMPEVMKFSRGQILDIMKTCVDTARKNGVTVFPISAADEAIARDRIKPVWDKWLPQIGPDYLKAAQELSD